MKKLYKLCDLEKLVLERLKEKGFKFIYRDSLEFCNLIASVEEPILDEIYSLLESDIELCVGFEIFYSFIKFPDYYKIDDLLSAGYVIFED